eukprot:366573-Chlamydomonas_euryale.AAC.14
MLFKCGGTCIIQFLPHCGTRLLHSRSGTTVARQLEPGTCAKCGEPARATGSPAAGPTCALGKLKLTKLLGGAAQGGAHLPIAASRCCRKHPPHTHARTCKCVWGEGRVRSPCYANAWHLRAASWHEALQLPPVARNAVSGSSRGALRRGQCPGSGTCASSLAAPQQ